jgi:hypothetical protein
MRDNRTARTQAGLLGSYSGEKGRLPEGQQKKVYYLNIYTLSGSCCGYHSSVMV